MNSGCPWVQQPTQFTKLLNEFSSSDENLINLIINKIESHAENYIVK